MRLNDKMKLLFDPRLYQILEQSEKNSFEIGIGISFFLKNEIYCACMCESVYARACMNERVWKSEDNLWELVYPSAMWDLGIKLRLSGLPANAFICSAIP